LQQGIAIQEIIVVEGHSHDHQLLGWNHPYILSVKTLAGKAVGWNMGIYPA
jgi:hypothetical protein